MIKTVKRIFELFAITSLMVLILTSCQQPTSPEIKQNVSPIVFSLTPENLVELSTSTKGTTIFYTLDGEEATVNSTKYSEPFSVTPGTVINVLGVKDTFTSVKVKSTVFSLKYSVNGTEQALSPNFYLDCIDTTLPTIETPKAGYKTNEWYIGDDDSNSFGVLKSGHNGDIVLKPKWIPYDPTNAIEYMKNYVKNNPLATYDVHVNVENMEDVENVFIEAQNLDTYETPHNVCLYLYAVNEMELTQFTKKKKYHPIKELHIRGNFTSICQRALDCDYISMIEVGEGVQTLEDGCFSGSVNLEKLILPSTLTSIGCFMVNNCPKLTTVELSPKNNNYCIDGEFLFNKDKTVLEQRIFFKEKNVNLKEYTSLHTIGTSAFYEESPTLETIVFPANLEVISDTAFFNVFNLQNIDISNTKVTTIGKQCFVSSNQVKSIKLNNKIRNIGAMAFDATLLTSLDLPKSVTTLGENFIYDIQPDFVINYAGSEEEWKKLNVQFDNPIHVNFESGEFVQQ